jgi:CubicO group peptidase (beta-lactamase class C family)
MQDCHTAARRRRVACLAQVNAVVITLTATMTFASCNVAGSGAEQGEVQSAVDRLFAKWTMSTPGCAVGVSKDRRVALAKAYGMADLEHDIRNTPGTIFEAGSISKQFTAAAVLLLARDGKLSLDDPARKYIPELPDYGTPLSIRQMLTHTSGLRDWGAVAAIGGWPRTTRAYTHAHVLDIVSRQRRLNFTPGTRWSYSNTGYNLAAIIVSRVSGQSLAEFTRTRIFEPLGMTQTSWRDDHTRVVKGRAVAYAEEDDGFHTLMPFEDVHGNGGLLTTVGDLLKWNENAVAPKVGDAAFVDEQQEPGRFSNGRAHAYALGLSIDTYKGLREVGHSGATAGYRANLVRFPDQHLSVAVLCNIDSAAATEYAHDVADRYLADAIEPPTAPSPKHTLTNAEIEAVEGLYRNTASGRLIRLAHDEDELRIEGGPTLIPLSASTFVTADGVNVEVDEVGTARVSDPRGIGEIYQHVTAVTPTVAHLEGLVGTYVSDEAEATLDVVLEGTSLVIERRPDTTLELAPLYADAFSAPDLGTVIFRRDAAGRPTVLSVVQDRVWDLQFTRR